MFYGLSEWDWRDVFLSRAEGEGRGEGGVEEGGSSSSTFFIIFSGPSQKAGVSNELPLTLSRPKEKMQEFEGDGLTCQTWHTFTDHTLKKLF